MNYYSETAEHQKQEKILKAATEKSRSGNKQAGADCSPTTMETGRWEQAFKAETDHLPRISNPTKQSREREREADAFGQTRTRLSPEGAGPDCPGGRGPQPLTFAVGVGHGEAVILRPVQEGEGGLATQQS